MTPQLENSLDDEQSNDELRIENERLRQAYKYIYASRNSVDEELVEAEEKLEEHKQALRELIPMAEEILAFTKTYKGIDIKAAVEKARKLIKK